jgi:hypothetical protein
MKDKAIGVVLNIAMRKSSGKLWGYTDQGKGLRLDRSTARYIYKAKNGKILVALTLLQKAKLIFKQYMQTLFNKDLFETIIY